MIKQVKKTSDVDEVNRLLDNGWLLMAESIDEFVLGASEKVWEEEKALKKVNHHQK
ncbi:hypothetical protein [Lactococcus lactis]|uniref:hypothetical protein n=1 Tax=Lactococcus lactis TaxID=1358 RepID=UPI0022B8C562|nr:hypothetical protein [Lactococcus lactis]MCZ8492012.1 hypothetical protein [Lactococcus lactis]